MTPKEHQSKEMTRQEWIELRMSGLSSDECVYEFYRRRCLFKGITPKNLGVFFSYAHTILVNFAQFKQMGWVRGIDLYYKVNYIHRYSVVNGVVRTGNLIGLY